MKKNKKLFTHLIIVILLAFIYNSMNTVQIQSEPVLNSTKFGVMSTAISSRSIIPAKYACYKMQGGKNLSLPIEWSNVPVGTKSFAIFMYDTNPIAKNFVHWVMINIPYNILEIEEGASTTSRIPVGSIELKNSSGSIGYTGPCPPPKTGIHAYKIVVYALNQDLHLSGFVPFDEFQVAVNGKVLAESEILGYFIPEI